MSTTLSFLSVMRMVMSQLGVSSLGFWSKEIMEKNNTQSQHIIREKPTLLL